MKNTSIRKMVVATAICLLLVVGSGRVDAQSVSIQNTNSTPKGVALNGDIWSSETIWSQGPQVQVSEGIQDLVSLSNGRRVILTPNGELLWYQNNTRLGPPKPLGVGTWHIAANDNTLVAWSRSGRISIFQDTTITATFLVPDEVVAVMPNVSTNVSPQDDSFLVVHETTRNAEILTGLNVQTAIVIDFYIDANATQQVDGSLTGAFIDTSGTGHYGAFVAENGNLIQSEEFGDPTLFSSSATGSSAAYMSSMTNPLVVCDSNHYSTIYLKGDACNVTPVIEHYGPNTGTFVRMVDDNTLIFGSDGVGYWKFPGQPQTYTFTGVATIYLNGTVAIDQPEQAAMLAYPNPFTDRLTIAGGAAIYDITGRLVHQDTNSDLIETNISTSLWASGMYTCVSLSGATQKILKQ